MSSLFIEGRIQNISLNLAVQGMYQEELILENYGIRGQLRYFPVDNLSLHLESGINIFYEMHFGGGVTFDLPVLSEKNTLRFEVATLPQLKAIGVSDFLVGGLSGGISYRYEF